MHLPDPRVRAPLVPFLYLYAFYAFYALNSSLFSHLLSRNIVFLYSLSCIILLRSRIPPASPASLPPSPHHSTFAFRFFCFVFVLLENLTLYVFIQSIFSCSQYQALTITHTQMKPITLLLLLLVLLVAQLGMDFDVCASVLRDNVSAFFSAAGCKSALSLVLMPT